MVDLFKAETVNSDILIDETMSIVTADENFEAISGNNALFIYTRYIHPDDVSRFTEALKDYAESGKYIVVRMLYQTGCLQELQMAGYLRQEVICMTLILWMPH